ncbi:MAG: carboxypeptidase regulatory-like domain-containing protein, partial [Candidatus Glassbacteria bacterium]
MRERVNTATLLFLLLLIFSSGSLFARIESRDEALRKIIDEVIDVDVDQVRLYITKEPVEAGTQILSWKRVEITAPLRGWAAFIDDHPTANFEHAVRYVFLEEKSERIHIVHSTVPPKAEDAYYEYPTEIGRRLDSARQIIPKLYTGPKYGNRNPGGAYAVILSGGASAGNNHIRYWNDSSNIYTTLTQVYEYPDENIFALISDGLDPAPDRSDGTNSPPDLDGDGDDDIMGPCVLSEIQSLFTMLGDILETGDQLFIFTTDHGGTNGGWSVYLNLWNWEELQDNVLESLVDGIPQCDMIFTMEQCFSGGFEDNLAWDDEGRVFSSAAAYDEYSWAMPPDYEYDTYVFYWTAAVKGEDAYGNPVDADYNGDGVVTMDEAFQYAELMDFSDETPQYHSNPEDLGSELSLWGTRSFIEGFVTDASYGNPLIATVRIVGGDRSTTTDITGYYELRCDDDTTVSVEASSYGYRTQQQSCYVPPDSSAWLDFGLEEALPGLLYGWVRSALDGTPIVDAEVSVLETPLNPQYTDEEGFYSFVIPGGATYQVQAMKPTYVLKVKQAPVAEGDSTVLSFALGLAESFEDDDGGYTG